MLTSRTDHTLHTSLLIFLETLGIIDQMGLCEGFELMAVSAFHSDEENLTYLDYFDQRNIYIYQVANSANKRTLKKGLQQSIKYNADKAAYFKENNLKMVLSEEELSILELIAYLENACLNHQPYLFRSFFNKIVKQSDSASILPLTSSQRIDEKGTLELVKSWSGIFTKAELTQYLVDLMQLFYNAQQSVSLVMDSKHHTIAIFYQHSQITIILNDINLGRRHVQMSEQNCFESISSWIFDALCSTNEYVAFHTRCIILNPHNSNNKIHLLELLNNAEKSGIFQTTEEFLALKSTYKDTHGRYLIHLALMYNEVSLVQALLPFIPADHKESIVTNLFLSAVAFLNWDIVRLLLKEFNPQYGDSIAHSLPFYEGDKINLSNNTNEVDLFEMLANKSLNLNFLNDNGESILHIAAQMGNVKLLNILFKSSFPPNQCDKSGKTPLFWAIKHRQLEAVRFLLEQGADVNANKSLYLLHLAVRCESSEIITELLKYGADINQADASGETPLHLAIKIGSITMMTLLSQQGANLNSITKLGLTPLCYAYYFSDGEMMDFLLQSGAINFQAEVFNLVLYAAQEGNLDKLKELSQIGFDLHVSLPNRTNAARLAAAKGHWPILEFLDSIGVTFDEDASFNTCFLKAAKKNQFHIIENVLFGKKIYSNKIDINAKDKSGARLIHYIANIGHVVLLERLLNEEYTNNLTTDPLEIDCLTSEGYHVYIIAAATGRLNILQLLHRLQFDIFQTDQKGNNLIYYATVSDQLDILKWVFNLTEFDVNMHKDQIKLSILKAIEMDLKQIIIFFMYNLPIDFFQTIVTRDGLNFLQALITAHQDDLVHFFLLRGLKLTTPNIHGEDSILFAVKQGRLPILEKFCDPQELSTLIYGGKSLVQIAEENDDYETAAFLSSLKSQVDSQATIQYSMQLGRDIYARPSSAKVSNDQAIEIPNSFQPAK